MNRIILFLTLCLFAPILSKSTVYRCASIFNETNLCYKFVKNNTDNIIYVDGCAEDEYCPYGQAVAYCTKRVQKKEDGESCSANSDCKSVLCQDEKCSRLEDGESCEIDANCGNFSFCDIKGSYTCKPLAKEGEFCADDYGCGFGLICHKKCIKPFTIEKGEPTFNFHDCKDGAYSYFPDQEYQYYCAEKKQLTPTCSDYSSKTCDFEYSSGNITIVNHEWCFPNWDYKPYCGDSSGSKFWKEYLETYEEEVKKVDLTKIKVTDIRHLFWTRKADIAYYRYANHEFLLGADKCVHDYFEQAYRPEDYLERGRRPKKFINDYFEKSDTPDDSQLKFFLQ